MSDWVLGIIGGSGLYEIEGLENPEWISIETPWGIPSDDILFAELDGIKLRFLPRHGRGHPLTCLLYTSPSPRDQRGSRMPSSA